MLLQLVDSSGDFVQAIGNHLFGDFLFVEENNLLDGPHAALQVFANGDDFADDDGRTRQRLQHAQLAALDTLGDFHFAFAREQRNRAHLAQIHANGVVRLFQGSRREIEFHVFAGFDLVEFLLARFRPLEHINTLRTNGGKQVLEIVGGMHVVRDQIVHLVIGEITLFLAHIDQFFDIVVLVF